MIERRNWSQIRDEQGVSLITVMMVILIMTLMGISILAVTGFERQISSAVSASEGASAAAESCVSTGANVLLAVYDNSGIVPAAVLANAVPPGPVPVANAAVLQSEVYLDGGNLDFPVGVGSVPNLVMTVGDPNTVGGYRVFGDIDRLYVNPVFGGSAGQTDHFYQITCVAQNAATGLTSQVGAVYVCNHSGAFCQRRTY